MAITIALCHSMLTKLVRASRSKRFFQSMVNKFTKSSVRKFSLPTICHYLTTNHLIGYGHLPNNQVCIPFSWPISSLTANPPFSKNKIEMVCIRTISPFSACATNIYPLVIQHTVIINVFKGQLQLSPLAPRPKRVLDVGTGGGIWALVSF